MFYSFGFENNLNEGGTIKNKIIKSIKNFMSDRLAVQKKFNNLFSCYRKEVLPSSGGDRGGQGGLPSQSD